MTVANLVLVDLNVLGSKMVRVKDDIVVSIIVVGKIDLEVTNLKLDGMNADTNLFGVELVRYFIVEKIYLDFKVFQRLVGVVKAKIVEDVSIEIVKIVKMVVPQNTNYSVVLHPSMVKLVTNFSHSSVI